MSAQATDTSTIIIVTTVVSALMAGLSQLITAFAPILIEKMKHKKSAAKKSAEFDKTLQKGSEIRSHLEKLLELNQIDRVTLWSLSNGSNVFKNTHLWNLQFFDEVSSKSVLSTKQLFDQQKLNLSYFSDIILKLSDRSVVLLSDSHGLENRVARELTTGTGTKSMYMTMIRSIHGQPMGLLIAESVHDYIETENEQHIVRINDIATRLSSML